MTLEETAELARMDGKLAASDLSVLHIMHHILTDRNQYRTERDALAVRVAELEAALRPFAAWAADDPIVQSKIEDGHPIGFDLSCRPVPVRTVTAGDWRLAVKLLGLTPPVGPVSMALAGETVDGDNEAFVERFLRDENSGG